MLCGRRQDGARVRTGSRRRGVRLFAVSLCAGVASWASQGSNLGGYGVSFRASVVSGTVRGAAGPVAGALVSIAGGPSTEAATDGSYSLHVDLGGVYTVSADGDAASASATAESVPGGQARLDFFVERPFSLELVPGWNLISFPVTSSTVISAVFSDGLRGSIKQGALWAWDASSEGYSALADEAVAEELTGYWVYSPSGGPTRRFGGTSRGGVRDLAARWNLLGPALDRQPPTGRAIRQPIWLWNAESHCYEALRGGRNMEVGEGYWLYTPEAVPNVNFGVE